MLNVELSNNPTLLFSINKKNLNYTVLGCQYGSNVHLLPKDTITNTSGIKRGSFQEGEGSSEQVSLLERKVNHVCQFGGWLHYSSGIRINIANQKIYGFAFFSPFVEKLAIETEQDIVNFFGEPGEIKEEFSFGDLIRRTYVYFESNLYLFWDVWDDKLTHINLAIRHD